MTKQRAPITIGVTGGIGSGKTTVCSILERLGVRIFRADDEGKRILVEDPGARSEVVKEFGDDSYNADGSLNRAFLAEEAFGDAGRIAAINRIVHPRVAAAFEEARRIAKRRGVQVLAKEAALIYESGGDAGLDAVIVVDAPEAERIRRVMDRSGLTEGQVRERIRHQFRPEELRLRADFVIDNTGTLDDLESAVRTVLTEIVRRISHS